MEYATKQLDLFNPIFVKLARNDLKLNGDSKNLRDVWLCKLCCASIFSFSEDCTVEHTTGIDLRGLKSYFSKIKSLNSFDGFENDDFFSVISIQI